MNGAAGHRDAPAGAGPDDVSVAPGGRRAGSDLIVAAGRDPQTGAGVLPGAHLPQVRSGPPLWVLGAAAVTVLWVGLRVGAHGFDQLDVRIYRMGATALWHRTGLYGAVDPGTGLLFTYPPFAAVLMLPAVLMPAAVAGLGMALASCVALARLCHLSVTRIGGIPGLGYAASFWIVLVVAFVSEPVMSTLSFGQVNLILVWVVVEDLTRVRGRGLGVGTGIAAAVKLVPGVFLVYLWLAGLRRAALRGVLAFALAGVVTAALFWSDSATFWSGMFADAGHVGGIPYQANQSALGVLARAMGTETPTLWMYLPSALVLVVSLALAAWFARHGDRNRGLILTAVGGLLASPISWSHHWVWWVPLACLLLADVAARRPGSRTLLAVTVVVFTARPIWWPPAANDAALSYSPLQQALACAYFLLGVAILAWHAHMVWRQRGRRSPSGLECEPGTPTGATTSPGEPPPRVFWGWSSARGATSWLTDWQGRN